MTPTDPWTPQSPAVAPPAPVGQTPVPAPPTPITQPPLTTQGAPPATASTPPSGDLSLRQSTEVQGNILAGFNKDHQALLFLAFSDQVSARSWLTELWPRIAVTKDVAAFNERFSQARRAMGGDDPENLTSVWVNVSLTSSGLGTLSNNIKTDLQNSAFNLNAFTQGPASRAALLGDSDLSAPDRWVVGRADQTPVDVLLTVAADELEDLVGELEHLRALNAKHKLLSVFEQRGATLPGDRAGHEHFGFKDGISQPGVRGFSTPDTGQPDKVKDHPGTDIIAAGEFLLGYPRQPVPGNADTAPRPHADWMKDGAFHVFRRLAQDVPGFWAQVTTRVHSLASDDPMREDELAAKLVGRWRSGTPIDLATDKDDRSRRDPGEDNNFEFSGDDQGHRCPRFAHIRKMYPRDDNTGDERRRLLRRGIPYGLPFDPASGRGHGADAERGLLFVAFMSSIEDQFEFLQQFWANNPGFPEPTSGPDPVIGSQMTPPSPVLLRRPDQPDLPLAIQRFVHTVGAVYAFAPSLTTLKQLAAGTL